MQASVLWSRCLLWVSPCLLWVANLSWKIFLVLLGWSTFSFFIPNIIFIPNSKSYLFYCAFKTLEIVVQLQPHCLKSILHKRGKREIKRSKHFWTSPSITYGFSMRKEQWEWTLFQGHAQGCHFRAVRSPWSWMPPNAEIAPRCKWSNRGKKIPALLLDHIFRLEGWRST